MISGRKFNNKKKPQKGVFLNTKTVKEANLKSPKEAS
jgi:hypothetical protein